MAATGKYILANSNAEAEIAVFFPLYNERVEVQQSNLKLKLAHLGNLSARQQSSGQKPFVTTTKLELIWTSKSWELRENSQLELSKITNWKVEILEQKDFVGFFMCKELGVVEDVTFIRGTL